MPGVERRGKFREWGGFQDPLTLLGPDLNRTDAYKESESNFQAYSVSTCFNLRSIGSISVRLPFAVLGH